MERDIHKQAQKLVCVYEYAHSKTSKMIMSRLKKSFPPGTFIPTKPRLLAVAQLCIGFSLVLWYLFQPFMGEYFALRSRMLLYEFAMGTSVDAPQKEKLVRQAQRFDHLPEVDKQLLRNDYLFIKNYAQRSPLKKMVSGLHAFALEIPPLELAWIFFSIVISLLILLKKEGARQTAWLLPLIAAAYMIDNQMEGKTPYIPPDTTLFPTEKILIGERPQPTSQEKQLLETGWKQYLANNWSQTEFSQQNEEIVKIADLRAEEGEFYFTIARLRLYHGEPMKQWLHSYRERANPIILSLYLLWNLLFAWNMHPLRKRLNQHAQIS